MKKQRIWVFQQNGSAEAKIKAIRDEAGDRIELNIFTIDDTLPPVVDDTDDFLPKTIDADMVLIFFPHPDLAYDLARLCQKRNVPSVASGKQFRLDGVASPPT